MQILIQQGHSMSNKLPSDVDATGLWTTFEYLQSTEDSK